MRTLHLFVSLREDYLMQTDGKGTDCARALRLYTSVYHSSGVSVFALRRRRRFISPSIAEMMNCDVLSPSFFTSSIPSTVSCGTRALNACDFALTLPVDITDSPVSRCRPSYPEKKADQELTCRPPAMYCCFVGGLHLILANTRKTKPGSAATLNRASNQKTL